MSTEASKGENEFSSNKNMEVHEDKVSGKKKIRIRKIIISAFVVILVAGWLLYGNTALQTTIYELKVSEEYENLDGFTIVQISDLHNAKFGKDQSRLIAEIENQEPDIIVITGDLIDSNRTNIKVAMEFVSQAVSIAPVYYVTGNHEGWVGNTYDALKKEMETVGVIVLDNCSMTESYGGTTITVAGVLDPDMPGNNIVKTKDAVKVLTEQAEGYTILLSHRPELFDTYAENNVDLVFAGHYHGGQFRIPFMGGVIAPGAGLFPEYAEGTFTENNTTMVVSRGVGNSVIPIRINNRPEIVVVELVAE